MRDPNDELGLAMPTISSALRLLGRALRLKCPMCGGGPVLRHWWKMREQCGNCQVNLERGESDYFIGSMMFNLVLSELLFAGILVIYLVAAWPRVSWEQMEVAIPLLMLLAPLALFPISKLFWFAFDLLLRPPKS